jgi:hypothetical protein
MNLLDKRFDYSYAISHRLEIPNIYIPIKNNKINLELLVTNGFVKLYTIKGRFYNVYQNNDNHTLPDWKFHFNINVQDIPKAWKLISETFLKHIINNTKEGEIMDDIIIAMKAFNTNLVDIDSIPKGREITIYIYIYDKRLNKDIEEINYQDEKGNKRLIKNIYTKNEERNFKFYYDFLIDIEEQLNNLNIRQRVINGVADGDLWLGKYVSIRNESYYKDENGEYIYPPDDKGWNSSKHKMPFNWIQIFMIRYSLIYKKKNKNSLFIISSLLFLFILITFYNYY